MQRTDGLSPIPFSMKFRKISTGELVEANNVVLTSNHSNGRTVNLKFIESNEIRKILLISIIELNGEEIFW
jgi:hypothetical protein